MGLIHTYQTGQTLAPLGGGSDGLPLGPFANWAALPASGENGALASVASLGLGNAYGIAVYDGGASEWALYMAWFDTFADMTAFSEPISTGALASVEETADNNENGVRYQYEGSWTRTAALTAGFVWALTQTQALTGADPTGIGLVRDGDYGVVTTATGPVDVRYKAACTRAVAAGGGTIPRWVTPYVWARSPVVQAYTEDAGTIPGWTVVVDTGCTVAQNGVYQRLTSPATNTSARLRCMVGTVTASTRFEVMCQSRTSGTASGNITAVAYLLDGSFGTAVKQSAASGIGFSDTGTSGPFMTPARGGTFANLPALASDPAFLLIRDEGRTEFDTIERNGQIIGTYRRDLQVNGANLVQISVQGSASGGLSQDWRGQLITYT
jgi:hypothetical protein